MKRAALIFFLFLMRINTFACMNAYQFKIYPVGIYKGNILTVDYQIRTVSQPDGNRSLKLGLKKIDEESPMWILKSFISTYDRNKKLISSKLFSTTYTLQGDYTDTLQENYSKAFAKLIKERPSMELFQPEYLSFCDFQKNCELVSVSSDSIAKKDYLLFSNRKYSIDIIKDTQFYGFAGSKIENVSAYYINSVRIYKTKTIQLILPHLTTGHDIAMGWFTNDPIKAKEDESLTLVKEHKPDFEFNSIKKATYYEPLLHHGYGFDFFVIN